MDDDATVRLTRRPPAAALWPTPPPAPPAPRRAPWLVGGLAVAALALLGGGLWWQFGTPAPTEPAARQAEVLHGRTGAPPLGKPTPIVPTPIVPTPIVPAAVVPAPVPAAPLGVPRLLAPPLVAPSPGPILPEPPEAAAAPIAPAPPLLDQAAIEAHRASRPTALRWAANPLVWVLDFPDLETQGAAMNRAAAFIEKARTPRDRVLDDAALAAAIAADGSTRAEYYFGHNYRASDLARMFAQAEHDGVHLNPHELWLRDQVALSRQLDRSRDAAILTIPGLGPEVDASLRRAILRHELAHGQFFTQPLFAAHVMQVWERRMTEAERAAIRAFLGREGYDTTQEEMMANEAMAYLLHTPDREVFNPVRELRWSEEQIARVRALFAEGAPPEP